MINCCQSLNGLENINADTVISDVLIVDNIDVETELASLQTQIDNVNIAVSGSGGYFILTCEFNGNSTNSGYFAFGGGVNSNALDVLLPNCVCIAYRCECTTAVAAGGTIVFERNGTAITSLGISYATGDTLKQSTDRNTSFTLGDVIKIRFNAAGSSMGGTLWRANYIFATAAIDGQNVSFLTPNFTSLQPNQTAFLTDTITTANNTQTHQLAFGIPRGKSISGVLGTVSTGTAAVSTTTTTDANGNDTIAFNFVLQTGAAGAAGPKGDKGNAGDDGNADPIVIAVATSAGAAAGGAAGGVAGSTAGASAGATSGTTAANTQFASLVDPRLQNVENKTYNIETPANVLAGKTTIGGATIELFPSGALELGGTVFGGNPTDTISLYCISGININGSALTIDCPTTLNDDVVMDGTNITIEGLTTINNNLDVNGDIDLQQLLIFNSGTAYDNATIQVVPSVNPTQNNTGTMSISSQFLEIISEFILVQDDLTNPPDYPFIKFSTNNFIGNNLYGTITCDTTSAPAVNNGGDFTFACNQLTTSNNLVVSGDLQVDGNFNLNNLTLNNLTINNILKTSEIKPLDNNVVIEIGNATSEINMLGATIELGVDTQTSVVEIIGDTVSLGENASCEIIALGFAGNPTQTLINGLDFGVSTDIINLGENGLTEQITVRADAIIIGDTTVHGTTTDIDTQIINIGINDTSAYPSDINIGSVESQVEISGDGIAVGDNFTVALNIIASTIAMGNSTITTDIINIDPTFINIGVNDTSVDPSQIIIGSENSITDVYGDVITVGDPNSTNTTQFLGTTCNILTNGTSIRTNALTMGSTHTTTADLTAQAITLLGTATTTLRGDTINIGNDNSTDTIQIGNSVSYTEIEGSQINIGVGSVLNTINIGNAFSVVNIQGNQNNAINVANMFFNQIGF
jgi:hypothetical protein